MRGAFSSAVAGALILGGMAGSASAITVTQTAYDGILNVAAPIYGTPAANGGTTGLFTQSQLGSQDSVTRSPYQDNGSTVEDNTAYSVLSKGSEPPPGSTALYNLPANATSFSILWGSPDDYNHIQLFTGANGVGAIDLGAPFGTDLNGSELDCYNAGPGTCRNLHWVVVSFSSDTPIGSFKLLDDGNAAFEYGLQVPGGDIGRTPLPAAVWLFGTVVAGAFGGARLRRRRKAA